MAAEKRFVKGEHSRLGAMQGATIITDTRTGVQYLFVESGYAGGLTILVDKDGKPLLDFDAGR